MKILLLGNNGQVGWELQRALAPLGDIISCGRSQVDLENPLALRNLVRNIAPQIIVNAAAYTGVDKAEAESDRAFRINVEAVKLLAEESKRLNAWLVHYSTDYVFDGTKTGFYNETDDPNPLSVYGRTKYQGEQAILESACNHLIFRTSWVYAVNGSNFAKTILKLANERSELKIISDQLGAPTSAELIADITALCIYRLRIDSVNASSLSGIYHLAASGETSWYEYAKFLIEESLYRNMRLNLGVDEIFPISTSEYPLPARRPNNSRLSTKKLQDAFGLVMPDWKLHVKRLVDELSKNV